MKLLILYEELAGYLLAGVSRLVKDHYAEVHIIRKEVNREAPFTFTNIPGVFFYKRSDLTPEKLFDLAVSINANVVLCGGWKNKTYLKICRYYHKQIPVILAFDNKWENTFKQNIAALISPFLLLNKFNHCWVPGLPQKKYALKLGFSASKITEGVYCADTDLFQTCHQKYKQEKQNKFPRRFIYVGRYLAFKGLPELWKTFIEIQQESPNDWELWSLGTGDLQPVNHEKIKHFGFIQPRDMEPFLRDTGIFVLPSTFEPWGVAVHEFAAAGFPLLCSSEVGSASFFLKEGYNGFSFKAGDAGELKEKLKKFMTSTDDELNTMSKHSVEKGLQLTPEKWAQTLMNIIKNHN